MISAEALAELMALGIEGEKLIAVVTIIDRDASRLASRHEPDNRSKEAIRSQNYRDRKKRKGVTIVTVASRDADRDDVHIDTSLPSLEKKVKKERKVSISMPSDWEPSPANIEYATSRGWPIEYAHSEATRFRDHGLSTGKKYRDIDAAWRNWVTSPYQKPNARGSPGGAPPRPGSREDRAERTYHALQKLSAFANGSHADEQRASGEPREATFGLLPFPKPS